MFAQHWSRGGPTQNLRGLNFAAAKRTAVQVAKQAAIVAQVNKMKHDLQYQASTDSDRVCTVYCAYCENRKMGAAESLYRLKRDR
jgi:hypothetical protein